MGNSPFKPTTFWVPQGRGGGHMTQVSTQSERLLSGTTSLFLQYSFATQVSDDAIR